MVKSPGPSPYARKEIKKEYSVYGILYYDDIRQRSVAVVAEESGEKAINLLEKALVEGRGYEHMRGQLNAEAMDRGFKTSKKGIIFAFDRFSNSPL